MNNDAIARTADSAMHRHTTRSRRYLQPHPEAAATGGEYTVVTGIAGA
jgi:hypothetical protein